MHARQVWFRAAIWVEVLVQAPFYAVAIYAVLLTIMPIVLAEQYFGPHASRRPLFVTAVYGAWAEGGWRVGQGWTRMAKAGRDRPRLAENGRGWPRMAEVGRGWPGLAEIGRDWPR